MLTLLADPLLIIKKDYNPDELVSAITNATAAGIRVSFGFLDTSASSQPSDVLSAVKDSRGVYATITVAAGSQNFINYVLLNGLTYNDNPQGYDSQLLAGLAETHFISGSDTVTLKYAAQQGERVNFTVTSISAGVLDVSAVMGGKTLNATNTTYPYGIVDVTAPSSGELDLQISVAKGGVPATKDAMFSVITNSNVPFKNCTVGVTGSGAGGGLSAGGKAGVGIGVTAALLGMAGLGGYLAYKHFWAGGGSAPPPPTEGGVSHFGPGGTEKMMPHASVYPVDPGHTGLGAPGSHGLTGPPDGGGGGGQGLAPSGPQGVPPAQGGGVPPAGAQNLAPAGGGIAPPPAGQGGIPPVNSPMSVPPTSPMSVPPTGGSVPPAGQPLAFIPPLVPPNALNANNSAPKAKGESGGGPQSQGAAPQQGDGQYYDMKSYPPGEFGQQHMGPGTQQIIGANGTQPMVPGPGSPASQGVTGPGASGGAYPPAPASQAQFGYGPAAQYPMGPGGHPGAQAPLGHGGESHAPTAAGGSYPPAPGSQAAPAPAGSQYTTTTVPGAEGHLHNSTPGGYQHPMGQGSTGPTASGNSYQPFSGGSGQPMTGAEGYSHSHPMGGPGGQHLGPPSAMGSDPSTFSHPGGQPMTGAADGLHTHTMQSHPGSPDSGHHHNGTVSPDSYHNGTMSPDHLHQHGGGFGDSSCSPPPSHPPGQGQSQSMSPPDSYYHQGQHGPPSAQGGGGNWSSSPYSPGSTAPTSDYMTPQGTGTGTGPSSQFSSHPGASSGPVGGDMTHPGGSGGDITNHPHPHHQDFPDNPNPDWHDYHDPDACSCSEGPGPDSDLEGEGADPTTSPGTGTENTGFYMPGAPFRAADKKKKKPEDGEEDGEGEEKKKHKHKRRRFPRLARSRVGRHHHHVWTGRDAKCEDGECVFNRPEHKCAPWEGGRCECKCRDEECEVYKRELREGRVVNVVS